MGNSTRIALFAKPIHILLIPSLGKNIISHSCGLGALQFSREHTPRSRSQPCAQAPRLSAAWEGKRDGLTLTWLWHKRALSLSTENMELLWQLFQKTLKEEAASGCLPASSLAHIYSGRNSCTGEAILNTLLGLIDRALLPCLLSLGIITLLNKMNEHAMLCATSAMYLYHFCIHFQKLI